MLLTERKGKMITKQDIRSKLPGYKHREVLVSDIQSVDDRLLSKRLIEETEIRGCFDELISLHYFVIENDCGFYRVEKTINEAVETFLSAPFDHNF